MGFFDRRGLDHKKMLFILSIIMLVWATVVFAGEAVIADDSGLWWKAITLIQGLLAYIYITGTASTKKSIEKLFDKIDALSKEKMDRQEHDRICPESRGH